MASISLLQLCSKALEELKKDHKDKEMVVYTVRGVEAKYYHYLCDGEDDRVGESITAGGARTLSSTLL